MWVFWVFVYCFFVVAGIVVGYHVSGLIQYVFYEDILGIDSPNISASISNAGAVIGGIVFGVVTGLVYKRKIRK
jgi:hypothetical protein